MPKSTKAKLAYQKKYNAEPENIRKRVLNNAARQAALKKGSAHIGDGTQVDHVVPLDEGGGNTPGNTRVVSRKFNEAWRKRQPKMYGGK